jgi:hypothetical protein
VSEIIVITPPPPPPRFLLRALGPGLAGSVALTLIHEGARRVLEHPPRMDVYGKRSMRLASRYLGRKPAHGKHLYRQALVGDILSNALYFAMVGLGRPKRPYLRGTLLGSLAGLGAVLLGPKLGLGRKPSRDVPTTSTLTVLWYTLGGLSAAWAARRLMPRPGVEGLV